MRELRSYLDHYAARPYDEEETVKYGMDRTVVPPMTRPEFMSEMERRRHPPPLESDSDAEDSCDEECYPGRLHASLGILGEELTRLTSLLSTRQRVITLCHPFSFAYG